MVDSPVGDTSVPATTQLVLVPRVPGPLVTVDLAMGRPRDDLDVLIDDLFGEPVEERSGALDVILVIAGLGLIAWAMLGALPVVAVLGIVALVLGLALPLRDALRRIKGRRAAARLEQAEAKGMVLDVSTVEAGHLARAYGTLLTVAGGVKGPDGIAAITAGHLAVTEVASLLHGAPPRLPAELGYVQRRTEAIGDLLVALQTEQRRQAARQLDEQAVMERAAAEEAARVTSAREELGSVGGLGSLAQLEAVAAQARLRPDDASS